MVAQAYHKDNRVFTSKEFMQQLLGSNQWIRISGAGTGHQNGVAERGIQTVVNMARTMLLHAALRSPEGVITSDLWPMAMDHAVWLYNRIPKMDTGLTPMEMWTRASFTPTKDILSNCHPWGCPVYVLEPKLQKSGVKIPKWAPRSRRGMIMGFSRLHSTLIGLILNMTTRSISPQFHVVYDDMFSTVHSNEGSIPEQWRKMITTPNARLQVLLDEHDDPELSNEWLSNEERQARENAARQRAIQTPTYVRDMEQHSDGNVMQRSRKEEIQEVHTAGDVRSGAGDNLGSASSDRRDASNSQDQLSAPLETSSSLPMTKEEGQSDNASNEAGLRRSSRTRKSPTIFDTDTGPASKWQSDQVALLTEELTKGSWETNQ